MENTGSTTRGRPASAGRLHLRRPSGFGAFLTIWSTQLVSILTSIMSNFALGIWMYNKTQSATAMAAVQVFYIVPFLIMSFFAGAMIDRYNRKLMLAVSDICSAIGTAAILAAFAGGVIELWMIYAAAVLMAIGNSFQWPAISSTITLMVPKEQLGRVNGMTSLMEAGPAVFAPILAGALMPLVGIEGLLAFDVATYAVSLGGLLVVTLPSTERSEEGKKASGNIFKEAAWGFLYIFERPSLLGLQLLLLAGNIFSGIAGTLFAPMILARTGSNSVIFGSVQTAAAIGGVAGGLAMSVWGGFKRKTTGIALGWMIAGLFSGVLFGLGGSLWPWAIALAIGSFASPIVNASNQSIWQAKVPVDLQGRVFSARRLIAWIANPITPLIGGTLADFVLEPAMRDTGSGLARALGPVFGTGPGAGMSIIMVLSGFLVMVVGAVGLFSPSIRNAESILPDCPVPAAATEAPAAKNDTGQAETGERRLGDTVVDEALASSNAAAAVVEA